MATNVKKASSQLIGKVITGVVVAIAVYFVYEWLNKKRKAQQETTAVQQTAPVQQSGGITVVPQTQAGTSTGTTAPVGTASTTPVGGTSTATPVVAATGAVTAATGTQTVAGAVNTTMPTTTTLKKPVSGGGIAIVSADIPMYSGGGGISNVKLGTGMLLN